MILDTLTYSIITISLLLTSAILYLAASKDGKNKQGNDDA